MNKCPSPLPIPTPLLHLHLHPPLIPHPILAVPPDHHSELPHPTFPLQIYSTKEGIGPQLRVMFAILYHAISAASHPARHTIPKHTPSSLFPPPVLLKTIFPAPDFRSRLPIPYTPADVGDDLADSGGRGYGYGDVDVHDGGRRGLARRYGGGGAKMMGWGRGRGRSGPDKMGWQRRAGRYDPALSRALTDGAGWGETKREVMEDEGRKRQQDGIRAGSEKRESQVAQDPREAASANLGGIGAPALVVRRGRPKHAWPAVWWDEERHARRRCISERDSEEGGISGEEVKLWIGCSVAASVWRCRMAFYQFSTPVAACGRYGVRSSSLSWTMDGGMLLPPIPMFSCLSRYPDEGLGLEGREVASIVAFSCRQQSWEELSSSSIFIFNASSNPHRPRDSYKSEVLGR
ncbi:hypothetical protein R3P38DRAFT_3450948 [Favolaschia claudopus]|uniref:Uncharacterized protein n=1 Tax=Favolaschia claudopus TaxID=2862362 RepID=A0AAV9ZL64_9AGAR